jgi:hypothetical protein
LVAIRVEGEYAYRLDNRPPTVMTRDRGYMSFLANPIAYENRAATASTAGRPPVPSYTLSDGTRVNLRVQHETAAVCLAAEFGAAVHGRAGCAQHRFHLARRWCGDGRDDAVAHGAGVSVGHVSAGVLARESPPYAEYHGDDRAAACPHTFFELGYAWEFYCNHTSQLFANNGYDVAVDLNRYMPDGATANPIHALLSAAIRQHQRSRRLCDPIAGRVWRHHGNHVVQYPIR